MATCFCSTSIRRSDCPVSHGAKRCLVRKLINIGSVTLAVVSSVGAGCFLAEVPTGSAPSFKYDSATGRLKEVSFDSTHNGRNDSVAFMDGTRVERIEIDEDEDGHVDRWEFYDANRRLQRAGFSRRHNGVLDATAFYGADGEVQRVEISTSGDGRFNRIEFYQSGALARVEEDTNGDGRVDKWETYAIEPGDGPGEPRIVAAAFDDAFRGSPTRRFVYRPDGGVLHVELDPDGDGIFKVSTAEK